MSYGIADNVLMNLQLLKTDEEKDVFLKSQMYSIARDISEMLNDAYEIYGINSAEPIGIMVTMIGANLEAYAEIRANNDAN